MIEVIPNTADDAIITVTFWLPILGVMLWVLVDGVILNVAEIWNSSDNPARGAVMTEDCSPLAVATNHAYSFWLFNGTAEGSTKEMDAEIVRMTKVGVPKSFVDAYATECRAIIQRLAKGKQQ